jgi:hypothetical protein
MADTFSCDYKEIVDINLWGVPVSIIKLRNLDDGLKATCAYVPRGTACL